MSRYFVSIQILFSNIQFLTNIIKTGILQPVSSSMLGVWDIVGTVMGK